MKDILLQIKKLFLFVFYLIPMTLFVFIKTFFTGFFKNKCSECGSYLIESDERIFCPRCDRVTKTKKEELT